MKYFWVLVSLIVLLQGVSNQEDLTEDEVSGKQEQNSAGDEPTPSFVPPTTPSGDVYFTESFSDGIEKWVKSEAKKDDGTSRYDGEWNVEPATTKGAFEEDEGLVLSEAAKHYAIAAKLDRPFVFDNAESFVVQYEVNFQNGLTCGGAYVKLLIDAENLNMFQDNTPYSIMFGPDKCGITSKIHFIVRFKNPVTGEMEEKHSKQSESSMDFFNDKRTHLFTLLIHSDGAYHIIVDQVPFLKGNLLEDMTPSIVPPQEIEDPEDRMPENWDEREKIPDPEAVKPDDWDEDAPPKIQDPDASKPDGWLDDGPEYISDPEASMPEDWDEEEDGEYEPPMIPNPACEEIGCGTWKPPMIQNPSYKGKWKAPLIDNPHYDGKWAPRKIDNPAYFEDATPFFNFSPISAIGYELWSMSEDIYFDNIIICSELAIANNYAREGWTLKMERERTFGGALSLNSWLDSFVELANTYPYLWALYAIAVVMPFVCCVGCCCIRSKPKSDETARRKKTDEPSPDDKEGDEPTITPVGSKDDGESFIAEADEKGEEGEEGSQAEDNGSQAEDNGSQAEDNGSQAEDNGSQAEDNGSQAEDNGSQAEDEAEKPASIEDAGPRKRGGKAKKKTRRED